MLSSYVYDPSNVCFIKDSEAISERLGSVLPIKDGALLKEGGRPCMSAEKKRGTAPETRSSGMSSLGADEAKANGQKTARYQT